MTQLFDTNTYEHSVSALDDPAATRLRSLPTGHLVEGDLGERTTQWRLDQETIAVGRRGIQAARQALQDAARTTSGKPTRRAA